MPSHPDQPPGNDRQRIIRGTDRHGVSRDVRSAGRGGLSALPDYNPLRLPPTIRNRGAVDWGLLAKRIAVAIILLAWVALINCCFKTLLPRL